MQEQHILLLSLQHAIMQPNHKKNMVPMKKIFSLLFASLLFASCASGTKQIEISNGSDFDRTGEMVEAIIPDFSGDSHYVLKDQAGNEVAYQVIQGEGDTHSIIFQADVKALSKSVYALSKGEPAPVAPKTSARFVPERKDDFAWENDLAAYRMYGPALANENPSNGVDLWLKKTSELIVDTFYYNELNKGQSYHVDHGKGLDCYKVAHTLGCGGIAPYIGDSLYVGNHYNSYEVKENGPLRSVFTLTYDSVPVAGKTYKQTVTITANAGSPLNKAVVTFEGDDDDISLAGGIYLNEGQGVMKDGTGFIAYAENAISNAGIPAGRNYTAVVINNDAASVKKTGDHLLLTAPYHTGAEFVYYFGGGWSQWQFPTDESWFDAIDQFAAGLKKPLVVTVK